MLLTLKRAGVPVLWSARVNALQGDDRVRSAHVAGRGLDRTYDVDVVALNLGFQPETGLARALGAKQRFVDVGLGHLACETDDDGRTSVPGVFAVGDGASLGGARVAMARGRLAGLAAARDLGLHAPDEPSDASGAAAGCRIPECAVETVPAAVAAIWHFDRRNHRLPLRGGNGRPSARGTGERPDIAAGAEEGDARRHGALPGALLCCHHRAALSRCARRFAFAAPRAPLRPVPAAPLMFEAPEFEAPLLQMPAPPLHLHRLPGRLRRRGAATCW